MESDGAKFAGITVTIEDLYEARTVAEDVAVLYKDLSLYVRHATSEDEVAELSIWTPQIEVLTSRPPGNDASLRKEVLHAIELGNYQHDTSFMIGNLKWPSAHEVVSALRDSIVRFAATVHEIDFVTAVVNQSLTIEVSNRTCSELVTQISHEWRVAHNWLLTRKDSIECHAEPEIDRRCVEFFGVKNLPKIRGKEASSPLRTSQYNVLKTLDEAGTNGLTKDELVSRSGHTDALGILKRVARRPEWRDVIQLAGKTGGRYRLR